MLRKYFVAIFLSGLMFGGAAQAGPKLGFGLGVSTVGFEATAALQLTGNLTVIGGFSSFSYDDTFTDDDRNSFGASASIEAPRAGVQFYPFKSAGLHIEGGVILDSPSISIDASPSADSTFNIGSRTYNAADIGDLRGSIGFENSTAPYVLLGWGRPAGGGLSLNVSLGAILYGAPNAGLQVTNCQLGTVECNIVLPAELAIEEAKLNNDVEEFEFWPFLRAGITYSF
ncbi:MAG: hypothetical protein ACPGGG_08240 [Parvibaculales bacterium]